MKTLLRNKKWKIRPVRRYEWKIEILIPETGNFDDWKEDFKKRREYWELNIQLMNNVQHLSSWLWDNTKDNFLKCKQAWNEEENFFEGSGKKEVICLDAKEQNGNEGKFLRWK
jgi:hypothetical protein